MSKHFIFLVVSWTFTCSLIDAVVLSPSQPHSLGPPLRGQDILLESVSEALKGEAPHGVGNSQFLQENVAQNAVQSPNTSLPAEPSTSSQGTSNPSPSPSTSGSPSTTAVTAISTQTVAVVEPSATPVTTTTSSPTTTSTVTSTTSTTTSSSPPTTSTPTLEDFQKSSVPAIADTTFSTSSAQPNQECDGSEIPRPTFCTNVDWNVSSWLLNKIDLAQRDLQVEMMYVNFKGTRECRRMFLQLQCRYVYPKCDAGPPCRSMCDDFNNQCPGSLQPCNSFPNETCYLFTNKGAHLSPFTGAFFFLIVLLMCFL